ncbi:MAG: phospholipase domain-containing protein [Caulobacteraceae bacterium]
MRRPDLLLRFRRARHDPFHGGASRHRGPVRACVPPGGNPAAASGPGGRPRAGDRPAAPPHDALSPRRPLLARGGAGALLLANHSAERAAVFHLYDLAHLDEDPARYTVGAGRELVHPLPAPGEAVDIFVLGPNGFHRRLTGRSDIFSVSVEGGMAAPPSLRLENLTSAPQSIAMTDQAYGAAPEAIALAAGEARRIRLDLADSHGWYDRRFEAGGQAWRVAGHVETGEPSYSDPAAGGPGPLRLTSSA